MIPIVTANRDSLNIILIIVRQKYEARISYEARGNSQYLVAVDKRIILPFLSTFLFPLHKCFTSFLFQLFY